MPNREPVTFQYARPLRELPEGWCRPSTGTIVNFQRSMRLGEVATHHPALHEVAMPIPRDAIQTRDTRELEYRLKAAADGEIAAGRSLLGLAAPQIGEGWRVLLANYSMDQDSAAFDPSALTLMINPKLMAAGDGTMAAPESCFSCGPLAGAVERPSDVYAGWFDLSATWQEVRLRNFGSIVLGHECDHLGGVLFPDRLREQGRPIHWAQAEEFMSRAYGDEIRAGREWPVICPGDQWEAMKRPADGSGPVFRLEDFAIN